MCQVFMLRHNVDFCKNEPRFMSLIIFHLNCSLLLMMKMNKNNFYFIHEKIRVEGRSPLSTPDRMHALRVNYMQ